MKCFWNSKSIEIIVKIQTIFRYCFVQQTYFVYKVEHV